MQKKVKLIQRFQGNKDFLRALGSNLFFDCLANEDRAGNKSLGKTLKLLDRMKLLLAVLRNQTDAPGTSTQDDRQPVMNYIMQAFKAFAGGHWGKRGKWNTKGRNFQFLMSAYKEACESVDRAASEAASEGGVVSEDAVALIKKSGFAQLKETIEKSFEEFCKKEDADIPKSLAAAKKAPDYLFFATRPEILKILPDAIVPWDHLGYIDVLLSGYKQGTDTQKEGIRASFKDFLETFSGETGLVDLRKWITKHKSNKKLLEFMMSKEIIKLLNEIGDSYKEPIVSTLLALLWDFKEVEKYGKDERRSSGHKLLENLLKTYEKACSKKGKDDEMMKAIQGLFSNFFIVFGSHPNFPAWLERFELQKFKVRRDDSSLALPLSKLFSNPAIAVVAKCVAKGEPKNVSVDQSNKLLLLMWGVIDREAVSVSAAVGKKAAASASPVGMSSLEKSSLKMSVDGYETVYRECKEAKAALVKATSEQGAAQKGAKKAQERLDNPDRRFKDGRVDGIRKWFYERKQVKLKKAEVHLEACKKAYEGLGKGKTEIESAFEEFVDQVSEDQLVQWLATCDRKLFKRSGARGPFARLLLANYEAIGDKLATRFNVLTTKNKNGIKLETARAARRFIKVSMAAGVNEESASVDKERVAAGEEDVVADEEDNDYTFRAYQFVGKVIRRFQDRAGKDGAGKDGAGKNGADTAVLDSFCAFVFKDLCEKSFISSDTAAAKVDVMVEVLYRAARFKATKAAVKTTAKGAEKGKVVDSMALYDHWMALSSQVLTAQKAVRPGNSGKSDQAAKSATLKISKSALDRVISESFDKVFDNAGAAMPRTQGSNKSAERFLHFLAKSGRSKTLRSLLEASSKLTERFFGVIIGKGVSALSLLQPNNKKTVLKTMSDFILLLSKSKVLRERESGRIAELIKALNTQTGTDDSKECLNFFYTINTRKLRKALSNSSDGETCTQALKILEDRTEQYNAKFGFSLGRVIRQAVSSIARSKKKDVFRDALSPDSTPKRARKKKRKSSKKGTEGMGDEAAFEVNVTRRGFQQQSPQFSPLVSPQFSPMAPGYTPDALASPGQSRSPQFSPGTNLFGVGGDAPGREVTVQEGTDVPVDAVEFQ